MIQTIPATTQKYRAPSTPWHIATITTAARAIIPTTVVIRAFQCEFMSNDSPLSRDARVYGRGPDFALRV